MVASLIALAGLVVGFLAGFTTFKRSLVWCRYCGGTLTCSGCHSTYRPTRAGAAGR